MNRYYPYKQYLIKRYGHPVYRVGVDAGFSCPHRDHRRLGGCIYCDQYGGTAAYQRSEESSGIIAAAGKSIDVSRKDSIAQQVSSGIEFLNRRYRPKGVSLYFQAYSNTFAPPDVLRELYDFSLALHPFTEFIVSTRPDCLDEQRADILAEYQHRVESVWVELGLQSAREETLALINRGHGIDEMTRSVKLLKKRNILISLHVILGLPGEGLSEIGQTAAFISEMHPDAVKIHNLHVEEGTQLMNMYRHGEIALASPLRHIEQAAYFLERIPGDVVIQRLVCDTPAHRLRAPRNFPHKGVMMQQLNAYLKSRGTWQGKTLGWGISDIGRSL